MALCKETLFCYPRSLGGYLYNQQQKGNIASLAAGRAGVGGPKRDNIQV